MCLNIIRIELDYRPPEWNVPRTVKDIVAQAAGDTLSNVLGKMSTLA